MTNGVATISNSSSERSSRMRMKNSVLPGLFVATGFALAYAGALAALLLGAG